MLHVPGNKFEAAPWARVTAGPSSFLAVNEPLNQQCTAFGTSLEIGDRLEMVQTASSGSRWVAPTAAAALALASFVALTAAAPVSVSRNPNATDAGATDTPQLVKEFNAWINGFLFSEGVFEWAGDTLGPKAAHYFLTYVRNFLGGSILYYVTAAMWHW